MTRRTTSKRGNTTLHFDPSLALSQETPAADRLYLGVDPGSSGGMVLVGPGRVVAMTSFSNLSPMQWWDWVETAARYARTCAGLMAGLEKVGGYMGAEAGGQGGTSDGSSRASGHTMFAFGKSVGLIQMALIAAGIPYKEVTPQAWQKGVGLKRSASETKAQWKNRLKQAASVLFPETSFTLATSDAALIAAHLMAGG